MMQFVLGDRVLTGGKGTGGQGAVLAPWDSVLIRAG